MCLAAIVLKWEIFFLGAWIWLSTATNKRRDREQVAAIFDLTDRNKKNYTGNKIAAAIRESLTTFFGKKNNTKD